ncbi:fork head domain-containing protein [Trichophaea hybrida]|nr:fork head domain-containing protein [Trichophaea hybrida]
MPPSTQRRPRTRRVGSSPPGELPDSSPSRPRAKRRKVVDSIETGLSASPQDQVNAVIATLAMPDGDQPVPAASKQWANEKNFQQNTHGVTAYAKVAGANWTYYVKDLNIRIGRPPDTRPSTAGSPTPPPLKVEDSVHIDLGPSKLVSRQHAVISYDTNGEHNWQIHVIGRNGVKVDDETFKKDTSTVLRSGSVIEIGGVQMMFVLPNKTPIIAPSVIRRARLQHYIVDEEQPLVHTPTNDAAFEPASAIAKLATSGPAHGELPGASRMQSDALEINSNAMAPAYQRGVLLELTEDMDYSQDAMKEVKPPYSYALLIAQAILSSDTEQLTLASIYQFIMDKYSFYRHSNMGWQNSIRHNLSLNKAFRKIPRRTDEPGKGMKWELLPEHREEYIKKLRKPSKDGRQRSSQPGSPSSPRGAPKVLQPQPSRPIASLDDVPDLSIAKLPSMGGSPQRSVTPPPMPSYRVQPLEAYTPDRGSRLPALRSADKTLSDTPVPPNRNNVGPLQGNLGSTTTGGDLGQSPTQPSPYGDDNNPAMSAVTPAPQRQHPRLAPPSTGQLPSSYLPTSSPAPFWKYVQFGSTPAKPNDFSPLKDLHSSSPPPVIPGPETGRRNSIRELGSPLKDRSGGFHLGGPRSMQPPASILGNDGKDDDDEDGGLGDFPGIDLTRFVNPA